MTSINTNYKANSVDPSAQTGAMDPTNSNIYAEIEAALREIEDFKAQNSQWLTEEQLVEMGRIETMLKASYAAMQAGGATYPDGMGEDGSYVDLPTDLPAGWSGVPDGCIDGSDPYGQGLVDDDPSKYGDFAGTISISSNGYAADPRKVWFQMTDDMDALYGESRGRDMIITAVFKDGHRESYVVKDGTVCPNPIAISASGLSHGVTIDFSRVIRVATGEYPGYYNGQQSMMFFHGSEHNDTIIGTQSADVIVGWAGDDFIDGMAGNDILFGDEGTTDLETYEAYMFDESYGGKDTIKGGAGTDTIYGQGNLDTFYKSDKGEVQDPDVDWIDDVADASVLTDELVDECFYSPGGDWEVESVENGEIVISNGSGNAGALEIFMPDGYNMAYAEKGTNGDLIITFVGEEGTFKIRIEDFFSAFSDDGVVSLTFNGGSDNDIIDFSRVTVNESNGQLISIVDGYNSDDIIIGAKNALLSDGVNMEDLLESTESEGQLNNLVDDGIFASSDYSEDDHTSADGYAADVNSSTNQIEITEDSDPETDPASVLNIKAPPGYEKGYLAMDGEGNIYVILVMQTADGQAETIVIKVDKDLGLGFGDINIQHDTDSASLPLVPITTDVDNFMDDSLIDSGDGNDIVINQTGGNNANAEDEVWIEPDPYIEQELPKTSSSSSSTTETDEVDDTDETDDSDDTDDTDDSDED